MSDFFIMLSLLLLLVKSIISTINVYVVLIQGKIRILKYSLLQRAPLYLLIYSSSLIKILYLSQPGVGKNSSVFRVKVLFIKLCRQYLAAQRNQLTLVPNEVF